MQLPKYLGNKTQKDGVERDGVSLRLILTALLKEYHTYIYANRSY